MRSIIALIGKEFFANNVHVLLSKNHEPIKEFLLDGLNKSLDEGVRVWRPVRSMFHLDAETFQFGIERLGKFGVSVMLHVSDRKTVRASLFCESTYIVYSARAYAL
jgi:hypothetical protein